MKLITEKDSSKELGFFTGTRELLIVGSGTVQIIKSVDGYSYPLTDGSGNVVEFAGYDDGDVIFNSQISNDSQKVRLSLKCTSGEVKYWVCE